MLAEIIEYKRSVIDSLPGVEFKREKPVIDVISSLREKPFITEVKKASPSMGDIDLYVSVTDQAKNYFEGGAGIISVLTDEKYFKGAYSDLYEVSKAVNLPVLCKDFIIDEKQIDNAYDSGADLILLIASVLSNEELKRLSSYAGGKGLEILFEIHDPEEVRNLEGVDVKLLGVNSRDLKTMEIDRSKAAETIKGIKGNFIKVAESGMSEAVHVREFKEAGAEAFLIGTGLMKSNNPKQKLKSFYKVL